MTDSIASVSTTQTAVNVDQPTELLSALCLEAASDLDDGKFVAGLSELLRAVSLRLEKAGA